MLVGDCDRELAAAALRRHFVQGRLTPTELGERLDVALRARTRADLRFAMAGLPLAWDDLSVARRVSGGVRRVRFFFALVRVWLKLNLALVLAFAVAVAVGAPLGMTLGAVVAAWALAGYGLWRAWPRGPAPTRT